MYKLLSDYRIIPRLLVTGYSLLIYQVSNWFMTLPDPTNAQAAFVSTIVGVSAAIFNFYVNSGGSNEVRTIGER